MDSIRTSKKISTGKYEGRTYLDVAAGDPEYVQRQISRMAETEVGETWRKALQIVEETNHKPILPLDQPIPEEGERICDGCMTASNDWHNIGPMIFCSQCLENKRK